MQLTDEQRKAIEWAIGMASQHNIHNSPLRALLAAQHQAAEPKGCPRCTSSTAAGCNDIGCGYLDAGSGEPNSAEPKGLTIEQIEKAALDFVKKPGMQGYVEPGDLIDFARALFSKGE